MLRQIERVATHIRHFGVLHRAEPLWRVVRPSYVQALHLLSRGGLRRVMNGTDPIKVLPELYGLPDIYEPDVWPLIVGEVRVGDTVADVGANTGLYTMALAGRVGPAGHVYAFEPDAATYDVLCRHVALNKIESRVTAVCSVVGDLDGPISFAPGHGMESSVASGAVDQSVFANGVTLDTFFANAKLDVLKIDVEGFEFHVLRGAATLLRDEKRGPRAIFIELHPFAWDRFDVSGQSLVEYLAACGYHAFDLSGKKLSTLSEYGEIVARRR